MPSKDFYCVELSKKHKGDSFRFEVFLTKKSLVRDGSLVVTSPELKEFLNKTPEGRLFRLKINTKAKPIQTGYISGEISQGRNLLMKYTGFYPFDSIAIKNPDKDILFEDLLRGRRLGTLIESRLFRYVKETYPHLESLPLYYAPTAMLYPRREQLKKIRGVTNPREPGELHRDYEKFKKFLKEKQLERVGVVNWKKKTQAAKRARLKKRSKMSF